MAVPPDRRFVDFCLELLAPLGPCTARRMFGGWGIYLDGLMFGLIAAERLYLKVDDDTRAQWEAAGCESFVYEAKGRPRVVMSYQAPPHEAMEAPDFMLPWARLALGAALRARAQSARPSRPRAKASAPSARVRQAQPRRAR